MCECEEGSGGHTNFLYFTKLIHIALAFKRLLYFPFKCSYSPISSQMTPTTLFTFTCPRNSFKRKREHIAMTDDTDNLTKRSAGRPTGSKTRQTLASKINEEDRDYFGYDSRKFLERALLRASTWEEGLKIARELRALQHASLQAIQTKTDTTHTITLRWSTPEELPSNEKSLIELSVDNYEHKLPEETSTDGKKDNSNN